MKKIRKDDREPQLRSVVWWEEDSVDGNGDPIVIEHLKDTPKIAPDDERRWQLELRELRQPPQKTRDRIIVPTQTPSG